MNSRIENGKLTIIDSSIPDDGTKINPTKDDIITEVNHWLNEGDIDEIFEVTKDYISYAGGDDGYSERIIYFSETDSVERIKNSMIYDDEVATYINPDKIAEFIYNCIDVNALASVKHIAFLWDKPIYDDNGDIEDYEVSHARKQLMQRVTDGCDEYAYEVGLGVLGITWIERSTVIINVSELVKSSYDIARDMPFVYDEYSTLTEAEYLFKTGLIQTICHEFRHLFYEVNEFTPLDGNNNYHAWGCLEESVEDYGNEEAEKLLRNPAAADLVYNMFNWEKSKDWFTNMEVKS